MDIFEKLRVLTNGAKYDVSCSSSGVQRDSGSGVGSTMRGGICHSFTADGRCISLLKILQTNACIYDCSYCVNRKSNDIQRACFTPGELAEITMQFYKKNYIEGLFLSSGIIKSPDYTMELMMSTLRILRNSRQFRGYIHMKVIPKSSHELIYEAGRLADRLSVNIELPTQKSLELLAPDKQKQDVFTPMKSIARHIIESKTRDKNRSVKRFSPAGQSTQLIVGASPETDFQLLNLSENLYQKMRLKRVYYSAYIPVNNDSRLPALTKPALLREHRLYQADWLLRFYGFKAGEIVSEEYPNLYEEFDPKAGWALRNLDYFPMEVNRADYNMLLRVPGIGVRSAQRIVKARRVTSLAIEDLKSIGVVLKRAKYFILARGKYYGNVSMTEQKIKSRLLLSNQKANRKEKQLDFFNDFNDKVSAVTGEL